MSETGQIQGGCQCGAVRYTLANAPERISVCHCRDCQKSAGAPLVAWAMVPTPDFTVTKGKAQAFNSSGDSFRYFCSQCGTGLYYINETYLPGIVDVQLMTLDTPEKFEPGAQVQTVEQAPWVVHLSEIPAFKRHPGTE
ncbi:GFA family protein [Hyphomonas sp. WL0036]|uniref:GFA family protein n=1 Tax=Hyphomonas sediminis TaxID=2866160 RepID=UPI001C7ECFA6|nr:GFA family protein [Hyphomonas sediminis]MBY9066064.1 GFA family protein [Hyphomonas sediminis]